MGAPLTPEVAGKCVGIVDRAADGPTVADALLEPGPTWIRFTSLTSVDAPATSESVVAASVGGRHWFTFGDPVTVRQGTDGPNIHQLQQPQLVDSISVENQQREGAASTFYASSVKVSATEFGLTHVISARVDGSIVATSVCDYDFITRPLVGFFGNAGEESGGVKFAAVLRDPHGEQANKLRTFVAAKATVTSATSLPR